MTTTVTIDAHAGWPVKVVRSDDNSEVTVPPHTKHTEYVHSGRSITITELLQEKTTNGQ